MRTPGSEDSTRGNIPDHPQEVQPLRRCNPSGVGGINPRVESSEPGDGWISRFTTRGRDGPTEPRGPRGRRVNRMVRTTRDGRHGPPYDSRYAASDRPTAAPR